MYFHKEQILKHLKCENCVNDLVNPRVMPCQMILCKNCYFKILLSMNEIDSTIDCICSNVHKIPVDGFPVCAVLDKLVSENCIQVSRGDRGDKLKQNLYTFDMLLNDFVFVFEKSIEKILVSSTQMKNLSKSVNEKVFFNKTITFKLSSSDQDEHLNLYGYLCFNQKIILNQNDERKKLNINSPVTGNFFIERFGNGSYVFAFDDGTSWSYLIDNFEISQHFKYKEDIKTLNILNVLTHNDNLILNFALKDGKMFHCIQINNPKLKKLKFIKLKIHLKISCIGDDKIFALSNSGMNRVHVFNISNLSHIDKFGQSDDNKLPFYFPKNITKLIYTNKKFYYLYDDFVYAVESLNGCTIRRVDLCADQLIIDSGLNLILISYVKNRIYYRDSNGKMIRDFELVEFPKEYLLLGENDGYLSFLDLEKFEIFEKNILNSV